MRDANKIVRLRGQGELAYKKMAENPNPPLETRKPLFALEYSKRLKDDRCKQIRKEDI